MTIYLVTIPEVRLKLGSDYGEIDDDTITQAIQDGETFVFKHVNIKPVAEIGEDGEPTGDYLFYTDEGTLDVMAVASKWKAVASVFAKILNIESSNMEFTLSELRVSKDPLSQALIKLYHMAEYQCDKYLNLISEGPKRIRGANLILPESATNNDWIYGV